MRRFIYPLATLIPCLIVFICAYSQQGNYWYFGQHAGLSFNTAPPTPLTDGRLSSNEGCATISDSAGHLLFYTDGTKVYNRHHDVMLNGADLMGHSSASNSAIIVPQPGNNFLYYVFTTDAVENNLANGYRYSIVDMRLNNGLGDVMVKNKLLYLKCTEKLTAVAHGNGSDVWILTIEMRGNTFNVFRLGCDGLDENPVKSAAGRSYTEISDAIGCLKASLDNKKLATSRLSTGWELFDFDNNTGKISNPLFIETSNLIAFGIEFSPNSQLIYVAGNKLYQYKIAVHDAAIISQSQYAIDDPYSNNKPAIQLGPDYKIYSGNFATSIINVIHNPDVYGDGCGYQEKAINLGSGVVFRCFPVMYYGITNNKDIDFNFIDSGNCRTIQFSATSQIPDLTEWSWDFGDGTTATGHSVTHTFPSTAQQFRVVLTARSPLRCGLRRTKMTILTLDSPEMNADFTSSSECGNKTVFVADASKIYNGSIVNWSWDFGDGTTSTGKNPIHAYQLFGTYTLRLITTAGNFCATRDTITKTVSVHAKPRADFATAGGCSNSITQFNNYSTIEAGNITFWHWIIGSHESFQKDTEMLFTEAARFPVQLIAVSDNGCADSLRKEVVIDNKPNAAFAVTGGCQGVELNFRNLSSIDSGLIRTYWWDFGNGATTDRADPAHSYHLSGMYTIRMAAVSQSGCTSDTVQKAVEIESVPHIAFSLNNTCLGNRIQFYNHSTTSYGAITKWDWQFDDGNFSNSFEPTHTYVREGNFSVSLTGTTSNGCTAVMSKPVLIGKVAISAGNDTIAIQNEQIQLKASGGKFYYWTPGTGLNARDIADPIAQLQHDQSYIVKGITEAGCTGYDTLQIKVFAHADIFVPTAFTPNNDGKNDLFGPVYAGIRTLHFFSVYNRWGQLLFSTLEPNKKWNGSFFGKIQDAGVYVWMVRATNALGQLVEKKGTVTLIR